MLLQSTGFLSAVFQADQRVTITPGADIELLSFVCQTSVSMRTSVLMTHFGQAGGNKESSQTIIGSFTTKSPKHLIVNLRLFKGGSYTLETHGGSIILYLTEQDDLVDTGISIDFKPTLNALTNSKTAPSVPSFSKPDEPPKVSQPIRRTRSSARLAQDTSNLPGRQ
ncbi:hypothetical protein CVT26_012656 [Gymnopilus dilepis]|uniref:Nucleoplasmin-like domain-containing protein n=1 Tax=Gymnopilus dilepis TaxID=231916 RepID=A0A409YPY3_9AGAR|nr:hypothetical protein CVT26_012656 [Gymnopilus dilepis]